MKINHNHYFIFIFILIQMILSCKKLYNPEIDADYRALVVQGLITNNFEYHQIKLTQSVPFDSSFADLPVPKAIVVIKDNENNTFTFNDIGMGLYISQSPWQGKPGNSYTLYITTKEGDQYESVAQEMPQPSAFDSIHGYNIVKSILSENSYGESFKTYVQGMNIYLDLNNKGTGLLPLCRFKSSLLLEYVYAEKSAPFGVPRTFYYWKTSALDEKEVISGTKYSSTTSALPNQELCFIPTSKNALNIADTVTISSFVLTFQEYNLNDQSYSYYKNINDQLSSGGKLFDPVISQLNGNIRCTNNPQKVVLGLFEVSTGSLFSYKVTGPQAGSSNLNFRKLDQPIVSRGSGVTINVPPDFWIY